MDDKKIIEMYWERDEDAIRETSAKYGKTLHLYLPIIFFQVMKTVKNVLTIPGLLSGTQSRHNAQTSFLHLSAKSPEIWR